MFFPEYSWKWVPFPGLNFTTHLLNLSSWETKIIAYCVKSYSKNWKNPIQKFIRNNPYELLPETSVQTILNKCYQSIPNISYKLISDKPFQIILTNYYQTLLSTTIWEFIPSDSYTNFYQRTLETKLTDLLSKNHFKQYISTKSFQTTHYKLLPEKPLQAILTIIRKWFQIIYIYI